MCMLLTIGFPLVYYSITLLRSYIICTTDVHTILVHTNHFRGVSNLVSERRFCVPGVYKVVSSRTSRMNMSCITFIMEGLFRHLGILNLLYDLDRAIKLCH